MYENDKVERNLPYKCTVLCYILEYIYIVQIAKRRKSCVCFQYANTRSSRMFSRVCMLKQKHDLCVSLLFVQYRYTECPKSKVTILIFNNF